MRGAGTLRLTRDVRNDGVFLSLGKWHGVEAVRAWKSAPEFRERLAQVVQHVDEFEPTELAIAAVAEAGSASVTPPAEVAPIHAV